MTATRASWLCIASVWIGAFAAWHLTVLCALVSAVVCVTLAKALVREMNEGEAE